MSPLLSGPICILCVSLSLQLSFEYGSVHVLRSESVFPAGGPCKVVVMVERSKFESGPFCADHPSTPSLSVQHPALGCRVIKQSTISYSLLCGKVGPSLETQSSHTGGVPKRKDRIGSPPAGSPGRNLCPRCFRFQRLHPVSHKSYHGIYNRGRSCIVCLMTIHRALDLKVHQALSTG